MVGNAQQIRPEVEKRKWKFSCIDGDPVLGDGLKCYATRLFSRRLDQQAVLQQLMTIADELAQLGITVLRRKIELVIFDDRSSTVRCTGGCVECHLDDLCSAAS